MDNKKLEQGSRYEAHDLDGDGIVTDEDIAREKEMIELFLQQCCFFLWFLPLVLMLSLTSLAFFTLHRLALWVHTLVYQRK